MKRVLRKLDEASEMKAAAVEIAVTIFGYKNHAGIDHPDVLTRRWKVTGAAAHDSRPFEGKRGLKAALRAGPSTG